MPQSDFNGHARRSSACWGSMLACTVSCHERLTACEALAVLQGSQRSRQQAGAKWAHRLKVIVVLLGIAAALLGA